MDWFSKYYATIDCESKVVTFWEPGKEKLVYCGCNSTLFTAVVSTSRAKKLIRSRCTAFLVIIMEGHQEAGKLKGIPVVRKFQDVFPRELPGKPLTGRLSL